MPRKRAAPPEKVEAPGKVEVSIEVPQNCDITVTDLKSLDEKQINDLLKQAKDYKVKFIILNAPFKVRQVEPTS
jgi:hypothetical protein